MNQSADQRVVGISGNPLHHDLHVLVKFGNGPMRGFPDIGSPGEIGQSLFKSVIPVAQPIFVAIGQAEQLQHGLHRQTSRELRSELGPPVVNEPLNQFVDQLLYRRFQMPPDKFQPERRLQAASESPVRFSLFAEELPAESIEYRGLCRAGNEPPVVHQDLGYGVVVDDVPHTQRPNP